MPSADENIIARVQCGEVGHVFELAETPKGLVEARIDGDPMTWNQMREVAQWINMATHIPDEKE